MDEVKLINGFLEHPIIDTVVKGLFAFDDSQQAQNRLESIKQEFQQFPEMTDENSGENPLIIWIKGFDVADSEAKHGHVGNFAQIYVDEKDGTYTIRARKIWQEARFHPERNRTTYKHPNKGYYVLKFAENKVVFPSKEAANEELMNMHEDFPETTIPNVDKLYISVFGKNSKGRNVLDKRILKVIPEKKGGFIIISKADRVYPPKKDNAKKSADNVGDKSNKSNKKLLINKNQPAKTKQKKSPKKESKGDFTNTENIRDEKRKKKTANRKARKESDVKKKEEVRAAKEAAKESGDAEALKTSFASEQSERDAQRKKREANRKKNRDVKGIIADKESAKFIPADTKNEAKEVKVATDAALKVNKAPIKETPREKPEVKMQEVKREPVAAKNANVLGSKEGFLKRNIKGIFMKKPTPKKPKE